jgi:hypothetical protein
MPRTSGDPIDVFFADVGSMQGGMIRVFASWRPAHR